MKRPLPLLAALALGVLVAIGATVAGAVPASAATLDAAEIADLRYMREEEKLARDVYAALYARYGDAGRVFGAITKSESRHTLAVRRLLTAHKVTDPVASDVPGVFKDRDLQKLYADLVAQGETSLRAALRVGVAVEELDIDDLKACIARTSHADIERVYTNLQRASSNHLRAFQRHLARR
jgi:hypothetical protein